MLRNSLHTLLLMVTLGLTACAHSYYYVPEIDGEGAIRGKKGGTVYTIPPEGPAELTMRVRSLGVYKIHGEPMLGMRMSFVRPLRRDNPIANIQEFVDPTEQSVRFGDGAEIQPTFSNPPFAKPSVMNLNGRDREAIELFYPLPKSSDGAITAGSFQFQWKVHYGNERVEQQVARFDRYDAAPQQAADMFFNDPDYPYDVVPMAVPGWQIVNDPFWWVLDPWGPQW